VPLVVASGTLLGMVPFRPGRVTTIAKILLVQGHRRVGALTASDSTASDPDRIRFGPTAGNG